MNCGVAVAGRDAVSPTQPEPTPRSVNSLVNPALLIVMTVDSARMGVINFRRPVIERSHSCGVSRPPSAGTPSDMAARGPFFCSADSLNSSSRPPARMNDAKALEYSGSDGAIRPPESADPAAFKA